MDLNRVKKVNNLTFDMIMNIGEVAIAALTTWEGNEGLRQAQEAAPTINDLFFLSFKYDFYKDGSVAFAQELMEWRKANAIHKWFVENVQDNEDDCRSYELTLENLIRLKDICYTVANSTKLIDGKITNGYTFDSSGKRIPNYEDGKFMEDSTKAEELLPTASGFFFGNTEYNEWYYTDVYETALQLDMMIKMFDDRYHYYYSSSW